MKIKELLKIKGRPVVTIGLNETVRVAIQKLVENNIGALPVCGANGDILGIVSERDLLKECSQRIKAIDSTKVKDIMTKEVAIGTPEDDLDYVMNIMAQKGIRHLPIMVELKLEAMVSVRDIVEEELKGSRQDVRYLHQYISGGLV